MNFVRFLLFSFVFVSHVYAQCAGCGSGGGGGDSVQGASNLTIAGCVSFQVSSGKLTCLSSFTWDGTNLNAPGPIKLPSTGTGAIDFFCGATPSSPPSGYVTPFCNSGNSNHYSVVTSSGMVTDLVPVVTSLTTTGNSGPATLSGGILNVPQYAGSSGAMTQIAQTVLTSPASSITFSSIPGTYSSLKITFFGSSSQAGTNPDDIVVTFNSDSTAAHYHGQILFSSGSTTTSADLASTADILLISSAGQNGPCQGEMNIIAYASTTFTIKPVRAIDSCWGSGTSLLRTDMWGLEWTPASATAINAIKLTLASAANFTTGTVATLYGVQ